MRRSWTGKVTGLAAAMLVCGAAEAAAAPPAADAGAAPPAAPPEAMAASIAYALPVTVAKVSMDLNLSACGTAAPTVVVTPAAGAGEHSFRLVGSELESLRMKRDIKLELHENRALKSINSNTTDQTGSIITGAIKLIGTILPVFAAAPPKGSNPPTPATLGSGGCNARTVAALADVAALKAQLKGLRQKLPTTPEAKVPELQKAIDVVVAEIARIKAGDLHVKLEADIPFTEGEGVITWTRGNLAKWWTVPTGKDAELVTNFQVHYCAYSPLDTASPKTCLTPPAATDPVPGCPKGDCAKTLVFREPKATTLLLTAEGADFEGAAKGEALAKAPVSVAQWGAYSYLPLKVGFGGSRVVALSLDEFGARRSFGWTSDARLASVVGQTGEAATAAMAVRTSLEGAELARQQAEIKALQTEQQLNQIRYCKAVIEAGGFVCPTNPAAPPAP